MDVGFDAHHVVGADSCGFLPDQADGVFAGVVDQRGQFVDFAAGEGFQRRHEAADEAQGVDGGAQHELQRGHAHGGEVPGFLGGQVAGDQSSPDAGSLCGRRQGWMVAGRADHHHFVYALERQHTGLNADDAVGAVLGAVGDDALQGDVAGLVEDVGELFDLATAHGLQPAENAAGDAHGVGDIAEGEVPGGVAGVEHAVEFLGVVGGGEFQGFLAGGGPRGRLAVDGAADGEELDVAVEVAEFGGDAADADAAILLGFGEHALERLGAAFVDDLGDLGDLAAHHVAQAGAEVAHEAHGVDRVAHDKVAGQKALKVEAVDFVAGQTSHDGHGGLLL